MSRYSPIAAVLVLVAVLVPLILPNSTVKPAQAQDVIMAPQGGRLEARDSRGEVIGPCPLKGTDVDVAVSGRFTRVTIRQKFQNPYADKIEAVYTFPMSHRAAVDQMVMTVGDRVVVGEVKERQRARRIYQAARAQGYVASLLEQERPNIFTQSVANIEPGAEIDVQISYVELLESKDGTFSFDFPMVVEPRYIPGTPKASFGNAASPFKTRRGVIVLGPAGYRIVLEGDTTTHGKVRAEDLAVLMEKAQAIQSPEEEPPAERKLMVRFEADYAGGEKEVGEFYTDGTGHVNGRWFAVPQEALTPPGAAFAPDTNQVPDASKITPMPVRPDQRAGHDISINVTIDTGGPGIIDLKTPLHETIQTGKVQRSDGAPRKLTVELKQEREIPNRDFVLTWRQTADTIEEATFAHTGKNGKFFSLLLQPPARVTDAQAVARELVFVLDTSGSMSGFPIDKAKDVMTKAIAALRPQDTFNVITFSGDTHILWEQPQAGTAENITAAQHFVGGQRGGGGTEMMTAIEAALMQPPPLLLDGHKTRVLRPRESVPPIRICCFMTDGQVGNDQAIIDAVKRNARTTRVFSFGIGNSANRYLLDGMARAGRGEVEYVLLNDAADAAVQRFSQRIQTPVLTDVELIFSAGLKVTEMTPKVVPDLFDVKPIVLHGKYTTAGVGTLTIRGRTGSGRYERTIPLELPAEEPEHDVLATLWARARVEELMNENLAAAQTGQFPKELRDEVVTLGETYGIMTQYTSFVAVEKQRVTLGGQPRLVHVPIEMAQGVSFEGIFGLDAVMQRGRGVTGLSSATTWGDTDGGREGRVKQLLDKAIQEHKARRYDDSTRTLEQVLQIDPQNDRAKFMKQTIEDGGKAQVQKALRNRSAPMAQLKVEHPAPAVPGLVEGKSNATDSLVLNGTFAYGENKWRMIAKRDSFGSSLSALSGREIAGDVDGDGIEDQLTEHWSRYEVDAAGSAAGGGGGVALYDYVPVELVVNGTVPLEFGRGTDAASLDNLALLPQGYSPSPGTATHPADDPSVTTRPASVPLDAKTLNVIAWLDALTANKQLDPARKALVPQRVAIQVAEWVKAGKLDDAQALVEALVKFDGEFKIGAAMRAVLADEKLAVAERDQKIAALAEEAKRAFDPIIRDIKLRTRLDGRLYPLAAAGPAAATQPAPEGIALSEGKLRVTVVTADVQAATLDALRQAGLAIEGSVERTRLVIGRVAREHLGDLGALDQVKRIEPTEPLD